MWPLEAAENQQDVGIIWPYPYSVSAVCVFLCVFTHVFLGIKTYRIEGKDWKQSWIAEKWAQVQS